VPARRPVVMKVFSTITSPVFSELVIVIGAEAANHLPWKAAFFRTLRTMNEVRPFKLVFLVAAPDLSLGEARRKLARALELATARGLLDFLDSPPAIRTGRCRERWWDTSFG
jgi:hypothetical protein